MRLKNIAGSREVIAESIYVVHDEMNQAGKWNSIFNNDHEIHIEIGMGKGKFITEMARLHPDINYIGIEKYSSVLLRAVQKMQEDPISNLYFVRMDAESIEQVFKENEIGRIYLNFSDPWPKDRHAKRRLPSKEFLKRYERILKKDGLVEFKTDNRALFDFALEEIEIAGWQMIEYTYDLHQNSKMCENNVMTEYEVKFSSIGNPICKYIIKRP